jgi:hypothetical protein
MMHAYYIYDMETGNRVYTSIAINPIKARINYGLSGMAGFCAFKYQAILAIDTFQGVA